MKRISAYSMGILAAWYVLPQVVFAQDRVDIPNPGGVFTDPGGATGIEKILNLVSLTSGWLLGIVTAIGILMLVVAGFMFITAGGDDSKLEKAKNMVKWIVIGLLAAILSWSIVNIVVMNWPTGPVSAPPITSEIENP